MYIYAALFTLSLFIVDDVELQNAGMLALPSCNERNRLPPVQQRLKQSVFVPVSGEAPRN